MTPERVGFLGRGMPLAGDLYRPDPATAGPLAAVIVADPFGGAKEQAAQVYARALAAAGFVALAFDSSCNANDNERQLRFLEAPFVRTEDIRAAVSFLQALPEVAENIRAAVSFLQALPEVDAECIGVLGISVGGGYIPYVAATDLRIKAVATVSGTHMRPIARSEHRIERSDEEVRRRLMTGQCHHMSRAQRPDSPNKVALEGFDHMAQFQAFALIEVIAPRPLLMIAGPNSISMDHSQKATTQTLETKELAVTDEASPVDLHDKSRYIDQALEKIAHFFGKHLR